jgi:peptidoglycan/xylan/chitin deacetylase (PgdA/CDA1 family)
MIRTAVKTGSAAALYSTGLDRTIARFSGAHRRPLIVGYHRVVEDFAASAQTSAPAMLVSRRVLEQHLDWIGRQYRFVTLDEISRRLEERDSSEPVAAVTFDDGYRDFYENAFPLLQTKGIPAAVFIITGLAGSGDLPVHDRLYLLLGSLFRQPEVAPGRWADLLRWLRLPSLEPPPRNAFDATRRLLERLSREQLQAVMEALSTEASFSEDITRPRQPLTLEMIDSLDRAGVTIGSHTHTHIVMTNESGQRMAAELEHSRSILEQKLGKPIRHFAYPDGKFNRTAVEAVAAAGYKYAYTTCRHRDPVHPALTIPRLLLWENSCRGSNGSFSGATLNCQIYGFLSFRNGCRRLHGGHSAAAR